MILLSIGFDWDPAEHRGSPLTNRSIIINYISHHNEFKMKVQGFVIEFIISAVLVLVVFGAAADEEASFAYHSCYIIFANTVSGKCDYCPVKKKLSPSIPVPNIQGVFLLVPP